MESQTWQAALRGCAAHHDHIIAAKEFRSRPAALRLLARLTGRIPHAPQDDPLECVRMFSSLVISSQGFSGLRESLGDGRTFHVGAGCKDDLLPVLKATYCDGDCIWQTRLSFGRDGSCEEWGIAYPLSETGVTGRCPDPSLESRYRRFDNLVAAVAQTLREA